MIFNNCFCVLLWCKTFRYFMGVQSFLLLVFGLLKNGSCLLHHDSKNSNIYRIYWSIYRKLAWKIYWSIYRKLAWVGFDPTTTEFRSDALTDWTIRPWVQLLPRANFAQLLEFHHLLSVTFHFGYCFRQSPGLVELKVSWGNHMSVAETIYITDITFPQETF